MSDVSTRSSERAPTSGDPSMAPMAAEHAPSPVWRLLSLVGAVAIRIYPIALLLGLWQLVVSLEIVDAFTMPPPTRVWERGFAAWQSGALRSDTVITLGRVLASFALAVVVGVTVGLLIGRVRAVRQAARPVVSFFFPTPKVAIYPALVIIFGLGSASKVALGFAEAVFPIILATSAAASHVDPRMLWSAEAFGTSRIGTFVRIILPASLPGIMTGARIGLVGAIIGVFMGELIVGAEGLGTTMALAYRTLQTADMYAAVVLISGIGFVLDRLFLVIRAALLGWSAEGDR